MMPKKYMSLCCYNPCGNCWELIDGAAFCMSPAPMRQHQQLSVVFTSLIYNHLRGKKCEVYAAPFDVRLVETNDDVADDYIDTVVQPDIVVICDPKKLDDRGCRVKMGHFLY